MSEIEARAAEMRRIVTADPRAPIASCTHNIGPLYIRLYRIGPDWSLSLENDAAIPPETCAEWGAAVGAPREVQWRATSNRYVCLLSWVDVGEVAPEVRGAAMWGGKA